MNKLTMNPNNEKYYSAEYIKGWEDGVNAQYEARPKGEWIDKGEYAECSNCGTSSGTQFDGVEPMPRKTKFCSECGAYMRNEVM